MNIALVDSNLKNLWSFLMAKFEAEAFKPALRFGEAKMPALCIGSMALQSEKWVCKREGCVCVTVEGRWYLLLGQSQSIGPSQSNRRCFADWRPYFWTWVPKCTKHMRMVSFSKSFILISKHFFHFRLYDFHTRLGISTWPAAWQVIQIHTTEDAAMKAQKIKEVCLRLAKTQVPGRWWPPFFGPVSARLGRWFRFKIWKSSGRFQDVTMG